MRNFQVHFNNSSTDTVYHDRRVSRSFSTLLERKNLSQKNYCIPRFVQETQPKNRIAVFAKMRSVAKRRDRGFRQNPPRVFEIQKKRAGREAGVYDEYIIQNFVLRANREANNYQYLT